MANGSGLPRSTGPGWRLCCTRYPRTVLSQFRLLVRPETALHWHRDLIAPTFPAGRPRTLPTDPHTGTTSGIGEQPPGLPAYSRRTTRPRGEGRRLHRLGDPEDAGVDPASERTNSTWARFLRSRAQGLIAADFFETVTLTVARLYVLAVIEHATRRVRILGVTPHPSAAWIVQAARNRVMDVENTGCQAKYLIRDRDGKYPTLFDTMRADAGTEVVLSGVQIPRMNSIMERGSNPATTSYSTGP